MPSLLTTRLVYTQPAWFCPQMPWPFSNQSPSKHPAAHAQLLLGSFHPVHLEETSLGRVPPAHAPADNPCLKLCASCAENPSGHCFLSTQTAAVVARKGGCHGGQQELPIPHLWARCGVRRQHSSWPRAQPRHQCALTPRRTQASALRSFTMASKFVLFMRKPGNL